MDSCGDMFGCDKLSKSSNDYTYPIDDIDWFVLQAWKGVVPDTTWMNEDCSVWPSAKLHHLRACLQARVKSTLPSDFLYNCPTPYLQSSSLRQVIDEKYKSDPCTLFNADATSPPLCLIHPALLSAFPYYGLAQYIGRNRPLIAVHGSNEIVSDLYQINDSDKLMRIAEQYTSLLLGVQPKGDYHLGGWSLGGLIAIEMAKCLHKLGKKVKSLSLIDPFFAIDNIIGHYKNSFIDFRSNHHNHPINLYFSSLPKLIFKHKVRKFVLLTKPMLSAFKFSDTDIPTLIIQSRDILKDHNKSIKKHFSKHKIIHSNVNHSYMMEHDSAKVIAEHIRLHLESSS